MNAKKIARLLLVLTILSLNIGCDQISKKIVRQRIDNEAYISLIDNHLILTKVENTGAFLSVGQFLPQSIRFVLLIILPIVILLLTFIYILNTKNISNITITGLCFIVGGGIGNIYDRIIHGSVTDFLHIDLGFFRTGIFNMADVSIMIGLFVILLELFLNRKKLSTEIAG